MSVYWGGTGAHRPKCTCLSGVGPRRLRRSTYACTPASKFRCKEIKINDIVLRSVMNTSTLCRQRVVTSDAESSH